MKVDMKTEETEFIATHTHTHNKYFVPTIGKDPKMQGILGEG